MGIWADISSVSVALVTLATLVWVGWRKWFNHRNRHYDRLIALFRLARAGRVTLPICPSVEFTPHRYLGLSGASGEVRQFLIGDEIAVKGRWRRKRTPPPVAVLNFGNTPGQQVAIVPHKQDEEPLRNYAKYLDEYAFVLGFDLSLFNAPVNLTVASNSPTLLNDIVSRCHWVVAGPRNKLSWRPYAATYTICENPKGSCVTWCSRMTLQGHAKVMRPLTVHDGRKFPQVERLFYESPGVDPTHLAWSGYGPEWVSEDLVRERVYEYLTQSIGTNCAHNAKAVPGRPFWLPVDPDSLFRELGWVLTQEVLLGQIEEVSRCRVRLTEDGYQGVKYSQSLPSFPWQDLPGDAIIEAFQKEWDSKAITFPFREQWDDAAEDIVRQVFPRTALPLTSSSKDAWKPGGQEGWGRVAT